MAFSLLIVDDEQTARESLAALVRWKDLGFEVCGTLDDGRKAIEFLGQRHVDVVLTDVRMTSASGIDVARYVHDNQVDTKVVLISGFQSFEDARSAVGYDVAHFLPKPTSLEEIGRVFRELAGRLAEERKEQELKRDADALLLARFFFDLLLGALRAPPKMIRRFSLIDPALELSRNCLCTVRVTLPERATSSDLGSYLLGDAGDDSATNPSALADLGGYSYLHVSSSREVLLCVLDRRERSTREFTRAVDAKMAILRGGVETFLGVTIRVEPARAYRNALAFAEATATPAPTPSVGPHSASAGASDELRSVLRDQRKLLVSCMEQADAELAMDLFDTILSGLEPLRIEGMRDAVVDLVSLLKTTLDDHGVPLDGLFAGMPTGAGETPFSYSDLACCQNAAEIRQVGGALLGRLMARVSEHSKKTERNAVKKAQEFIREGFARPISLESVADHVFLSPIYLSRLFKEKTGQNFVGFLTGLRIEKARDLLASSHYRIYEVAEAVGYPNVKYFTRVFRKSTGLSPSEFREKLGIGHEGDA